MANKSEDKIENLLSEYTSQSEYENIYKDSTLVLLGDSGWGKKSIVKYISQEILKSK